MQNTGHVSNETKAVIQESVRAWNEKFESLLNRDLLLGAAAVSEFPAGKHKK